MFIVKDTNDNYTDNQSIVKAPERGINSYDYISYTGIASGLKYWDTIDSANKVVTHLRKMAKKTGLEMEFGIKEIENILDIGFGKAKITYIN